MAPGSGWRAAGAAIVRQPVLALCALALLVREGQALWAFSWRRSMAYGPEYGSYGTVLHGVVLTAACAGVALVLWPGRHTAARRPVRTWIGALLLFAGASIGFSVWVNPLGLFPWNKSPVYLAGGARSIKLDLYLKAREKPEVIILGSSKAHAISAGEVTRRTGRNAFNWSVEGGGPVDALAAARYLLSARGEPPAALVVEVQAALVSPAWSERTPVALLPYLPDAPMAAHAMQTELSGIFGYRGLVEALYTYRYVYGRFPGGFEPDGTMIPHATSDDAYGKAMRDVRAAIDGQLRCAGLEPEGKIATEALSRLTQERNVGLVFYLSPLNGEFLATLDTGDPAYRECQRQIDRYMAEIRDRYPKVMYRNLTWYGPISDLGRRGFHDIEHLNEHGARAVIEAILPDIQKALARRKAGAP